MDRRQTESLSPGPRATDPVSPEEARAPKEPEVREGEILLGKYRVEGVIGSGGMGIVVAAMHLHLKVKVALKLLRPSKERGRAALARLLREAQAGAKIRSEPVARVMDVGALETGAPCIVME